MRSVYYEEMDHIWAKYKNKIKRIGYINFLTKSPSELQKILTMSYKDLHYGVMANAIAVGKPRPKVKYSILKLRRLIALWTDKGVMTGNYNITYSAKDINKEFPMFDRQTYELKPTISTINRIKVLLIKHFIGHYNEMVEIERDKGNFAHNYITNLKELRGFFLNKLKFNPAEANNLVNLYRGGAAQQEVWDFSENLHKSMF